MSLPKNYAVLPGDPQTAVDVVGAGKPILLDEAVEYVTPNEGGFVQVEGSGYSKDELKERALADKSAQLKIGDK